MLATILRYPFTGGAVVLVTATAVGALPHGGILTLLVATSFALTIVRASRRSPPEGDRMPRLLPPPPGLTGELLTGLLLQLVYFGPLILILGLAFLAEDVPELGFLSGIAVVAFGLQLLLGLAWPAAVVLLVKGEHPFTVLTGRVMRQIGELGARYAAIVGWLVVAGSALLCGAGPLREQGLAGRLASSALMAWFWLVTSHLVGRMLRSPSGPAGGEPSRPGGP